MSDSLDDSQKTAYEILTKDARCTWAFHEYDLYDHHPEITDKEALLTVTALSSDEHVELMLRGGARWLGYWQDKQLSQDRLPTREIEAALSEAALILITMRRAIVISDRLDNTFPTERSSSGGMWIPGNPVGKYSFGPSHRDRLWLYLPNKQAKTIIAEGAGEFIQRLPSQEGVPTMPSVEDTRGLAAGPQTNGSAVILTGWESLEDLATLHLRDLGFLDAHKTKTGKDGGIDIYGKGVAAQVKMTALPVGRPVLQQLVGATQQHIYRVCYSTSGYTKDAISYASDFAIPLFEVGATAVVTAANRIAERFKHTAVTTFEQQSWGLAYKYIEEVLKRAGDTLANHDWAQLYSDVVNLDLKDQNMWDRGSSYLDKGSAALEQSSGFDSARGMIVHYHHAELLIAVGILAKGGQYPKRGNNSDERRKRRAIDFY